MVRSLTIGRFAALVGAGEAVFDALFPSLRNAARYPFNRQRGRQELVRYLLDDYRPTLVVETGSYRGATASWLAKATNARVVTVEAASRFYWYCLIRFWRNRHVAVVRSDSRAYLTALRADPTLRDARVFVYLDAHWYDDLPLASEVQLIADSALDALVVIDDFAVSGDQGYGFDDYGPGKRLDEAYLRGAGVWPEGRVFWPAVKSDDESGDRRGCVVMALGEAALASAASCSQLRPAS